VGRNLFFDAEADDRPGIAPRRGAQFYMSQSETLLSLGEKIQLFTSPDGACYTTFEVDGRTQTHQIGGRAFESYLVRAYYQTQGKPPNDTALRQAINTYAAKARFDGVVHPVYVRVAGYEDRVYLDLADAECRVIEIDAGGWRLSSDVPVRFLRPAGMQPLPMPEEGGSIEDLRQFVNVEDDDDFTVIVAYLLGALRPTGPFAHLELLGEQGSAKSTTARIIRSLIDPNFSPLKAEPGSERDLAIAASNVWMPVWDNLSHMKPWMSDSMCRLSTGGGFSTRALYTDADEKTFQLMRPAILTAIGDVAVKGDLLDRMIILRLPRLTNNRVAEDELWSEFSVYQPFILGALLDAVSMAIKNIDKVRLPRLPRLADFAKWVTAGESAFGWEPGTCVEAFIANQDDSNIVVLESSFVALMVMEVAQGDGWSGTATDLLDTLVRKASRSQSFTLPKTPGALRSALNKLKPNLRRAGIDVVFAREGKASTRMVHIQQSSKSVGSVGVVGDEQAA